jgi:YHS domain-containing protein
VNGAVSSRGHGFAVVFIVLRGQMNSWLAKAAATDPLPARSQRERQGSFRLLVYLARIDSLETPGPEMSENSLRVSRLTGVSQLCHTSTTTINIQPNMKKTNLSILLAVGILGVTAFAPKSSAAECAMPGCCGMTTTMASEVSTNATPDLLTTCPVSGEKLGEMGKPVVFTYKNQEVKLCCSGCKKDFDKNPEKYIKLIRAADKKK